MTSNTDPATPTATIVAGDHFTHDNGAAQLRITVCGDCQSRWFPPVAICSCCAGTNVADVDSGTAGVAYASTVVRVGPPEFAAPYVLSYVDIDGVRVLAHTETDAALTPDTPVHLTFGQIGTRAGSPLLSYKVRPASSTTDTPTEGGTR